MPETPETVHAITAEMRMRARCHPNAASILEWAVRIDKALDRIEAAAERERNAHMNDIHDALYKATGIPGNAAAMREALERCNELFRCDDDNKSRLCNLARKAYEATQAALAAPTRNCDRFHEYHDAVDAWHREERCLGHHQDGGTCANDPLASTLAPVCFARWLFAKAEGGDHA